MLSQRTVHGRGLRAIIAIAVAGLALSAGCREEVLHQGPGDGGSQAAGLTPKQASLVLAQVGDKAITLGEFAATLERMDPFDRGRYKTPERRRELLEEMITVELLAREAERRGLDKDPKTQEALRQVLRDALLRDARRGVRSPSEFTEQEVKAYYEAHKKDYLEPERRRVGHLVVHDQQRAEKLLEKAREASSAVAWGKFVAENSDDYDKNKPKGPVESAGDLGLVGPPGDRRGANPRVPDPLRVAVFQIGKVGEVLDRVIADGKGGFHILRLNGLTQAHARTLLEAERTIRILLSQREVAAKEEQLEAQLRKKFPVTIDDGALASVKLPSSVGPNGSASSAPQPPKPGGHEHAH